MKILNYLKKILITVVIVIAVFFLGKWLINNTIHKGKADTIFINAKVYTLDEQQPTAQAVAVKDGKIITVGTKEQVLDSEGLFTKVIDLKGKMMLPGFVESHFHATNAGVFGQGLWLADLNSKADYLKAVKDYADNNPDVPAIIGFGWKSFAFADEPPTKADLDAIVADKPVFLFEVSAHNAWANSKALAVANITAQTKDPQPNVSYFKRDNKGEPTGFIVEVSAEMQVFEQLQELDAWFLYKGLDEWFPKFSQEGITTIFEAGNSEYDMFAILETLGELSTRTVTSYYANDPTKDNFSEFKALQQLSEKTELIEHKFLKINVDGDPATHSVKLYQPYKDNNEYGATLFNQQQLNDLVKKAVKDNVYIHFHAMGDASLDMVLTASELAKQAYQQSTTRFSLAHGYLIAPKDFQRLADLDFVVSFAGNWINGNQADIDAENRLLGSERFASWYPLNSLNKAGVKISLGSDFPVSGDIATYRMLDQIQYVVTRQLLNGSNAIFPPKNERVSLSLALKMATINGAYLLGMENEIGSIKVGKKADLIVLDKNLFELPPTDIHKVKVIYTMMNGAVTYQADE